MHRERATDCIGPSSVVRRTANDSSLVDLIVSDVSYLDRLIANYRVINLITMQIVSTLSLGHLARA